MKNLIIYRLVKKGGKNEVWFLAPSTGKCDPVIFLPGCKIVTNYKMVSKIDTESVSVPTRGLGATAGILKAAR